MTKLEFIDFLRKYKELNEIAKDIVKDDPRDFRSIFINGGKIFANFQLSEEDITKELLSRLIPDDIVF